MTSEDSESVLKLFLGYCVLDLDIYNLRKFPVKIVYILFGTLLNLMSFQFIVTNMCFHRIYLVFKSVKLF